MALFHAAFNGQTSMNASFADHQTMTASFNNAAGAEASFDSPKSMTASLNNTTSLGTGFDNTVIVHGGVDGLTPATRTKLGGIKVGEDLEITQDGVLSVTKATEVEQDNTRPITSAAVYAEVGNINALLATI